MASDGSQIPPDEASRVESGELLSRLASSLEGLTRREASARLAEFGENAVARERPVGPMRRPTPSRSARFTSTASP